MDFMELEDEYPYDDFCYECRGYGDDWYEDNNGDMVCACNDCPFNDLDDWE